MDAGSISCDFAPSVSLRRFADLAGNDAGDTGWLFYFPRQNTDEETELDNSYLADVGDTMPAKIYMKFMVDDQKGDINGNWQFVNGHTMLLTLESITIRDINANPSNDVLDDSEDEPADTEPSGEPTFDMEDFDGSIDDNQPGEECNCYSDEATGEGAVDDSSPANDSGSKIITDAVEITEYVTLSNGILAATVTTSNDGGGQVSAVAKEKIGSVKELNFAAVDETIWSQ